MKISKSLRALLALFGVPVNAVREADTARRGYRPTTSMPPNKWKEPTPTSDEAEEKDGD